MIVKQFTKYQFEYWPLIWMFHSRALNNKNDKINSIHDRAIRITSNESKSPFEELLNRDKYVSIHHRKLHVLVIKMFQIKNNNFRRLSR